MSSGTTTIKYTDVNGCEQTHDVTVNGLPAVNAGTDFSTCEGSQISLSGGGANSYSWDNGVTNGSIFTATSTTTYTVTGTNSNNCVNTDQITVTVNPVPTISGATTVCEGETISLSVDLSSGTWDSDDDGVATVSASGVVTGVGNGTTNVTYVVNGCTDTYSVTVHSKPTISGTFTATAGGSSVTFRLAALHLAQTVGIQVLHRLQQLVLLAKLPPVLQEQRILPLQIPMDVKRL